MSCDFTSGDADLRRRFPAACRAAAVACGHAAAAADTPAATGAAADPTVVAVAEEAASGRRSMSCRQCARCHRLPPADTCRTPDDVQTPLAILSSSSEVKQRRADHVQLTRPEHTLFCYPAVAVQLLLGRQTTAAEVSTAALCTGRCSTLVMSRAVMTPVLRPWPTGLV